MRHVLDEWACSSCLLSSRTVDREPRHDEECAAGRRPHESMSDLRCFTLQRDELRASATSDRHELFRIALVADDLCEWLAASAPRVRTRLFGRNGPADHDDRTRGPPGGGAREPLPPGSRPGRPEPTNPPARAEASPPALRALLAP